MISRRTAHAIAEAYTLEFAYGRHESTRKQRITKAKQDKLYDYLYANNYPVWFCARAKTFSQPRQLKEFIMKLHTNETQYEIFADEQQRKVFGQNCLKDLAKDILWRYRYAPAKGGLLDHLASLAFPSEVRTLHWNLELDGYVYRDGKLLSAESDVLDAEEEQGVLYALYTSLALHNRDVFRDKLRLSEEHYLAGRWSDAIANARLVLEGILQEVAAAHSVRCKREPLDQRKYDTAVEVRKYLEQEDLLRVEERQAIQHTYGLLSNTGSHPYMAEKDQARLLRQMALVLAQFVLLRLEGALTKQGGQP